MSQNLIFYHGREKFKRNLYRSIIIVLVSAFMFWTSNYFQNMAFHLIDKMLDSKSDHSNPYSAVLRFINSNSINDINSNDLVNYRSVNVEIDGTVVSLQTRASTIKELLNELVIRHNLEIFEDELVDVKLSDQIVNNMTVKANKILTELITEEKVIAFETTKKTNNNMDFGIEKVSRDGKNGIEQSIFEVKIQANKEIGRSLVESKVVEKPVNKIIEYGTKKHISKSSNRISLRNIDIPNTSRAFSRGDISSCKCFHMTATAYSKNERGCSQTTATGHSLRQGIVAVDPRVIRLGTRVFVEGYGEAVALDTGRLIKGNRIDVSIDNLREAICWGVKKNVKVYILD